MFIIFGWRKETEEIGNAMRCHCYRCQRTKSWTQWRATEWVSFFGIKTIPFLFKNFLVCDGCGDNISLNRTQVELLASKDAAHPKLVMALEDHQFANKTELQRNFLRSQRAESDTR